MASESEFLHMAGSSQLSEKIKDINLPWQKISSQTAIANKNNVFLGQKMVIILVLTGFSSTSVSILVQIRSALQKYQDKLNFF